MDQAHGLRHQIRRVYETIGCVGALIFRVGRQNISLRGSIIRLDMPICGSVGSAFWCRHVFSDH